MPVPRAAGEHEGVVGFGINGVEMVHHHLLKNGSRTRHSFTQTFDDCGGHGDRCVVVCRVSMWQVVLGRASIQMQMMARIIIKCHPFLSH